MNLSTSKIIYDHIIVGAGLTGLTLAKSLLRHTPSARIVIIEKSRGSGGRMATRRIEERTYDHGAQFIKQCPESQFWLDLWKKADSTRCFLTDRITAQCGNPGMTKLAKVLGEDLEILFESKALSLSNENGIWSLKTEPEKMSQSKNVILTCPLPQTLDLLRNSKIDFPDGLNQVRYAKALVLLLALESTPDDFPLYQENLSTDIFSVTSQDKKGTSLKPALTVVMSPEFSELHFDLPDDVSQMQALDLIKAQFKLKWPGLTVQKSELKKWRYSHPINCWQEPFLALGRSLYLAGDAFGGPSLIGALRSSDAIFKVLKK